MGVIIREVFAEQWSTMYLLVSDRCTFPKRSTYHNQSLILILTSLKKSDVHFIVSLEYPYYFFCWDTQLKKNPERNIMDKTKKMFTHFKQFIEYVQPPHI